MFNIFHFKVVICIESRWPIWLAFTIVSVLKRAVNRQPGSRSKTRRAGIVFSAFSLNSYTFHHYICCMSAPDLSKNVPEYVHNLQTQIMKFHKISKNDPWHVTC